MIKTEASLKLKFFSESEKQILPLQSAFGNLPVIPTEDFLGGLYLECRYGNSDVI